MGLQRPLLCSRRRREALLVLRTLDVLQRLRHQGVLAKHLLDIVLPVRLATFFLDSSNELHHVGFTSVEPFDVFPFPEVQERRDTVLLQPAVARMGWMLN